MSTFGRALVAAARARGQVLAARTRNPRPIQERTLRWLTSKAASTQFGRRHGLSRIRDVAGLRAALPVHGYEDLRPWFLRALEGEPDVVWPGKMSYFGWSSGTTAGNKYLPLSMDSVRAQRRRGFDPVAAYLRWTGDAGLMDGRAILLGGSSELTRHASGVLVGDNTGVMAHHVPRLVRRKYRPSPEVRAIADWDRKIPRLVAETLHDDVRLIAGTPSWFPGLFDQLLADARRAGLAAETVLDVWPNLRLLTGGGINYEPYRPLIEARLGRSLPYVDVYNATEGGIMGVQDRPDDGAMLLLPDNDVFYEFVPVEDIGKPSPRRLATWEVEPGHVYAIVVSTPSGIFSYAIGDCLRFTSVFPHRFFFEGRTAAFLNVTGEHVSQGELERAVRAAAARVDASVVDFTVGADVGVSGGSGARHVYFVEFEGGVPDLDAFARAVDDDIRAKNDDYDVHRKSAVALLPPRAIPLTRGAFHDWMKARGKLGAQNKIPRVLRTARERDELEALTSARGPLSLEG